MIAVATDRSHTVRALASHRKRVVVERMVVIMKQAREHNLSQPEELLPTLVVTGRVNRTGGVFRGVP